MMEEMCSKCCGYCTVTTKYNSKNMVNVVNHIMKFFYNLVQCICMYFIITKYIFDTL